MRTVQTLCGVVLLVGALVYFNFGTLSPCGVLRETVRQHDGLAAVLPDSVVDLALAGQYGALSPGRCVGILLEQQSASKPAQAIQQPMAPQQVPQQALAPQDALQVALRETQQVIDECRAKRIRGELPTFVASAQCSNPRMIQAFGAAHYRYMDLIAVLAAKRLELGKKIDRKELTEDQGKLENAKLFNDIVAAERQRDSANR
jgi:hypothetical protein